MLDALRGIARGWKEGAIEGQWINRLTPCVGADEARRMVREAVEGFTARLQAEGADALPDRCGDYLISSTDPKIQATLAVKRADGVTDEDIRWWWNLTPLERELEACLDTNATRIAMLLSLIEGGLTQEEAGVTIRRTVPMYAEPGLPSRKTGDDRPLPWEMKRRVNAFLLERAKEGGRQYSAWLETAPTVNALVRHSIRTGELS